MDSIEKTGNFDRQQYNQEEFWTCFQWIWRSGNWS